MMRSILVGGGLALVLSWAASPRLFAADMHAKSGKRPEVRSPAPLTEAQEQDDLKDLQSLTDSLRSLQVTGTPLSSMPTSTGERVTPAPRALMNP